MPATRRLHVLRPGLHLGTVKKNRLEPAHAPGAAISPQEACHSWNLSVDGIRARHLGRADVSGRRGEGLVSDHGRWIQPRLGASFMGFVMKNHYPKAAGSCSDL